MFTSVVRGGCVAVLVWAALATGLAVPGHAANDETPQVGVGATTTLELDGNPTTGYRWVLDAEASGNADLVAVEDGGYAAPEAEPGKRPVLGAPKKQRFLVTGVAPGEAMLVFRYVRSGDDAPAKTAEFLVEVIAVRE